MPRESQQAIAVALQEAYQRPQDVFTNVVAAPVSQGNLPTPHDTELDGLVSGLASFNPQLQQYIHTRDGKDKEQAAFSGDAQSKISTIDPGNVSALPESMPEVVNPAFRPQFDQAYKLGIANRLGIEASAKIQAEYDKQKINPDFNVDTFLDSQLQAQVGKVSDPLIAKGIAEHAIDLSRQIRVQDNAVKLGALKDATVTNITAGVSQSVTAANNDPQALSDNLSKLWADQRDAALNYFTRPELSEMVVKEVTAQSVSDKGTPALFDALDKIKDPTTGKTIAETSPHLAMMIAEGRKAAEKAQDQRIERDAQPELFKEMAAINKRIDAGERIPLEWYASNIGNGKQFASHEAALSAYKQMEAELSAHDDLATTLKLMNAGKGYIATPAQQKAASDYATTPLVNSLVTLLDDPSKQGEITQAAGVLANVHAQSNLTVPNEVLKRFVDGLSSIPADSSGNPTPRFLAANALYQAFPPTVRKLYFGEGDTDQLFKSYAASIDGKVAPATAYQQAYAGISAEAKEREKELTKSPDWQKKMTELSQKAVDGLRTTWKDFVPFANNLPSNISESGATLEAKRYLRAYPNMGDDDLKAHLKSWVADNYIHDTNTNLLIGVPPGLGQAARKPVEWYQDQLVKKYGEDSRPTLVYMGNGNYQVHTRNPISNKSSITWGELQAQHTQATMMSPEELASVAAMNKKAMAGTLTPEDVQASSPLLSKVRSLGLESKLNMKGINDALDNNARSVIASIPKMTLGNPTNVLGVTPTPGNDRTSQQNIVGSFMQNAQDTSYIKSGSAAALTGALITSGEGVVLRATPDPAGGAGNNIGMGYNLNANKETLTKDFRQAGIPVEAIPQIVAGTKSITEDQAQRLLQLSIPRYASQAKSVIESKYPGMWDKMTPHQQAVVTDVAYQVKDFSKFGNSIDALVSGDQSKIDKAFQVQYTDHNGVTKVDTRRNNLRANMLKGTSNFMAVLRNN